MVTVVNFESRENKNGDSFNVLIVQGGIEPVKSASGQLYFTARKASVPASFDDATCNALIGTEFPGYVEKVPCEPYSYTVEQTGETITIAHRYEFIESAEEVMQKQVLETSSGY